MELEQWSSLTAKQEFKISEESALAELKRLCDYYDVDIDETTQEQSQAVNQILSRLRKSFRAGKLELKEDDNGLSVVQHLKNNDTLAYRELKGADKAKLSAAGDDPVKRMHYLMGLLCGYGLDAIGKLSAADLRVVEALSGFFLVLC